MPHSDRTTLSKVPHDSYRHEAFLWSGEDDFLAGTAPFIREGLRAGQPVMVAVTAPHIWLLRTALGTDADRVRFVDMAVVGRNPARIIPAWREFLDVHASDGRPVRGIGEPIWPGRRPEEVMEGQLHEALLTVAIEQRIPLWLLCPYDVQALALDVVTEAQLSHPVLFENQGHRSSSSFGGPHHIGTIFEGDLPPVEMAASQWTFGRENLPAIREDVTNQALRAGLSRSSSVAAAQSRADSLRTADVLTLAEARSKRASQGVDLRKHGVGPVGLEPTTYGLKERPKPAWKACDRPFRAWFVDAG